MKLPAILHELRRSLLPVERPVPRPAGRRRAAVLILLYPRHEQVTFALTERPVTLSRHPGQISLPGGMEETHDPTLWHTALRETQEELGLKAGRVMPIGRLDDVATRTGGSVITPFVAWNPSPPRFVHDRREVAEVIETPLADLLDESLAVEEDWILRGAPYRVGLYRFDRWAVWGITALILDDFRSRLRPLADTASPSTTRPGRVRPLT